MNQRLNRNLLAAPALICMTSLLTACGTSEAPRSNAGELGPEIPVLNAVDDIYRIAVSATSPLLVLLNDQLGTEPTQITSATTNAGVVTITNNGQQLDFAAPATPGTAEIIYTIQDSTGETSQAVARIEATDEPLPQAAADSFDLLSGGRGAPLTVANLISNDDAAGSQFTALNFPTSTSGGGALELDDQGSGDFQQHILRYTPPADAGASDSFDYEVRSADNSSTVATVTINLTAPAACDADIALREASGLGWCFETFFNSVDAPDNLDQDGTGTDIAIQVFVPHPWHQRQLSLRNGATLAATESGFTPLLIHSHGFGGSKQEDFQDPATFLDNQVARAAWVDGYNVMSYTQRGFGGSPANGSTEQASGDSLRIMDPRFEGFDFIRVVDWALCHYRADAPLRGEATDAENNEVEVDNCGQSWGPSLIAQDNGQRVSSFDDNPALATVGYSYGGGFQFLAQSVDPRVDAIMPMGTWHDLRYSLHPNDTPKFTWIQIMTQFSLPAPPLGGGNGEPLPDLLIQANSQATVLNTDQNDAPHTKFGQVSVQYANELGEKGAVAWCNGNQDAYNTKSGDTDGEPIDYDLAHAPAHARDANGNVFPRQPRADIFMIQGYNDTLFNFNEGQDNARCFEDAAATGADLTVRLLHQTSGHPVPTVGGVIPEGIIPPHYAGSDTGMYLDEIVHCGRDEAGQPIRYNMVETGKEWLDFQLSGFLQPGKNSLDDIFPAVCVTQTNADPDYNIDANDPFFSGTDTAPTAHRFSREGVVFDRVADVPVGGQIFTLPETSVVTGAVAGAVPQQTTALLHTVTNPDGEVLAGIPLVHFNIARAAFLGIDEVVYAGIYVDRCNSDPDDTVLDVDGSVTNCTYPNGPELLHFQSTPIRPFPASGAAAVPPGTTAQYPQADPRNFPGAAAGSIYPIVWGGNPQSPVALDENGAVISSLEDPQGRLAGVSARLYPGDQVGVAFAAGHIVFLLQNSKLAAAPAPVGQVTITGSVGLPLVNDAPAAPPEPNDPCIAGTAAAAAGVCE